MVNEMGALLTDAEWKQSALPPAIPKIAVTNSKIIRQKDEREVPAKTEPLSSGGLGVASSAKTQESVEKSQLNKVPATLYLRVDRMDSAVAKKASLLCEIFSEGITKVIFYDGSTGKYNRTNIAVTVTPYFLQELTLLLGKENVVLR